MSDSGNDIGGKVSLDLTDFMAKTSELTRQIKVIDSGFSAVAAGMDDWSKSEEGLKTRIDALNQKTDLQKQKVQNLTEQYNKVAEAKGKDSKAAQDLEVRINRETATLNANVKELNADTVALKNFNNETLKNKLEEFSTKLGTSQKKMIDFKSAAIGIAATVAGGFGLFQFAQGAIDAGNNAYILGQKLHVSGTEATQLSKMLSVTDTATKPLISTITSLDKAVGKAGTTEDKETQKLKDNIAKNNEKIATLQKSNKMTDTVKQKIKELQEANATYTAGISSNNEVVGANTSTLEKYGVKLTDASGKLLTIPKQLDALAAAYQKASDAGNDEAFTADVLGTKGAQLVPLLENYTKAKEEAAAVKGIGIDPTEAHEAEQQLTVLKLQFTAFSGVLAKSLVPVVEAVIPPLLSAMQQLMVQVKAHKVELDALIKSVIQAGQNIGSTLVPIITGLFNFLASHGEATKVIVEGIVGAFVALKVVKGTIDGITGAMTTWNNAMKIAKSASGIFDTIKIKALYAGDAIKGAASWVLDLGKSMAQAAVNAAKMTLELGRQAIAWIVQKAQMIASTIATNAMAIAQAALNFVMALNPITLVIIAIAALVAAIIVLWNTNEGFRNALISVWNSIKSTVVGVVSSVISFVQSNWQQLLLFLVNPIAGAVALLYNLNPQFRNWANSVGETIKDGFNGAISFITSLPSKALQWGKDFINGLINGIKSMIGEVGKAAASVAATITGFLHHSVPDKGPMKDDNLWMKDFMKNLAGGINDNDGLVTNAVASLASKMANGVQSSQNRLNTAMSRLSNQIVTEGTISVNSTNNGTNNNTSSSSDGQPIFITVQSNLDGKKVAEGTAKYDNQIQGSTSSFEGRLQGV